MTGLYAAVGILAALTERSASGKGQHVDLALLDVAVATMANQATNYLVGNVVPQRIGNSHPSIVPYQCFATSDGYCIIAVGSDLQFQRFCSVLDQPDIAYDQRYATNKQRVLNRDPLIALITQKMLTRPRDEWLKLFTHANVPSAPINNLEDVFRDPQVLSREMKISINHPQQPKLDLVGNPIKLSRTPVSYHRPPPMLGEHTSDILENLDD